MPSSTSCATLRRVALLDHMPGFIAGASSSFLVVASSMAVARSYGQTVSDLRHQVGRGGRDHDESASHASRIWPTSNSCAGSNRSVKTCLPVMAPAASGVMNSSAAFVKCSGRNPAFFRAGGSVERLVGGDAAADDDQHAFAGLGWRAPAAPTARGECSPVEHLVSGFVGGGWRWCGLRLRSSGRSGRRAGAAAF